MPENPGSKPNKESSLMEKLQLEAKEGTKRFTIDLRESVHRKLSILAAKTGRSKADIVRMLLDDALEDINE
jgi:macrodomain Ter protein organizer (MatP/YcbG family)